MLTDNLQPETGELNDSRAPTKARIQELVPQGFAVLRSSQHPLQLGLDWTPNRVNQYLREKLPTFFERLYEKNPWLESLGIHDEVPAEFPYVLLSKAGQNLEVIANQELTGEVLQFNKGRPGAGVSDSWIWLSLYLHHHSKTLGPESIL